MGSSIEVDFRYEQLEIVVEDLTYHTIYCHCCELEHMKFYRCIVTSAKNKLSVLILS